MPKDAKLREQDGIRVYTWKGVEYPSVTSVRRIVGLPFLLHQWTLTQYVNAAIALAAEGALDPTADDVATVIRRRGNQVRDEAANRGLIVHASVADGLRPEAMDPDLAPYIRQYHDFQMATGAMTLLSERQVFNLRMGYAGSFDLIDLIDMRTVLIDIKTGGAYIDHLMQLIGYLFADFVGEGGVIDEAATRILHAIEAIALLQLTPTSWHYQELVVTPEAKRAFGAMLTFAHFLEANPGLDAFISVTESGSAPVPEKESIPDASQA
jgi:hypothetical protein